MKEYPTLYLVGSGRNKAGLPTRIYFSPPHPAFSDDNERIIVLTGGPGIHSEGPCLSAAAMLAFRPHTHVLRDGEMVLTQESPDWFRQKCEEAHCAWFIPLVERIASGKSVNLEEIQETYLGRNSSNMAQRKWGESGL